MSETLGDKSTARPTLLRLQLALTYNLETNSNSCYDSP
jgi:hypothetical protein